MKIDSLQSAPIHALKPSGQSAEQQLAQAHEVQEMFRQFVGETFFGQMLKSMRSTQQKPAYFHGGQGEEVFRNQLDQVLSEEMTAASADRIADPMFRQQFPQQAALLERDQAKSQANVADLLQLRRR